MRGRPRRGIGGHGGTPAVLSRLTASPDAGALGATLLAFGFLGVTLAISAEEDAFIYYRYAWHWAHGRGLTFNPGQAVEGFSSPLWMAALALLAWARFDLPRAAPLLGLACGAATLGATWRLGATVGLTRTGRLWVVVPLGVSVPFIVWSRSGLETPFYALGIVATVAGYLVAEYRPHAAGRGRRWLPALGLIVVGLGRPEGCVLAIVIVADRLLDGRDWRGALAYGLPSIAVLSGFLIWRLHAFESLVPNTAVKLNALLTGRSLGQAAGYLLYLGALPALLPFVAGWSRAARPPERRVLGVLGGCAAASLGFHVLAGGDYRPGFRYLIPALPLVLVAIALAFDVLRRSPPAGLRMLSARSASLGFGLLLLAGPATWLVQNPPRLLNWHERVVEPWRDPFSETGRWEVRLAHWVHDHVAANGVVAFGQMGRVPYFAARQGHDVWFVDTLGLVDRDIARIYRLDAKLMALWRELWSGRALAQALEAGRRDRAGRAAASVLARRPDVIIVETAIDDARTRALLGSPHFRAWYREVEGPDARGGQLPARIFARQPPS